MGKINNVNYFSVGSQDLHQVAGPQSHVINTDDVTIVLNGEAGKSIFLQQGQVYQLPEPRLILVTQGTAEVHLDLERYSFSKGKVILTTPDMILEPIRMDDDVTISGIVFREDIHVSESIVMDLLPKDFEQMKRMLYLLCDVARLSPYRRETVLQLATAMISNVGYIKKVIDNAVGSTVPTRSQQLFQQFKTLVSRHCDEQRNIPFYADCLRVSPHHLSTVISKASGHSVMYWINRAVLLRAKVLLRTSEMMIYEISERLHFTNPPAFNYFFKRETGMSPNEYRAKGQNRAYQL